MVITKKTKISDVISFLSEEDIAAIMAKTEGVNGTIPPVHSLTIAEFLELTQSPDKFILNYINIKDISVWDFCVELRCVKKGIEDVVKYLEKLKIDETQEEYMARKGLPEMTFGESLLLYAQQKFFLKSFVEAEKVKVSEVLLHKKQDYIQQQFERNLHKVYEMKNKINRR